MRFLLTLLVAIALLAPITHAQAAEELTQFGPWLFVEID